MESLTWESVEGGLDRASISGGWLVRQSDYRYDTRLERSDWLVVSTTFVPDPEHKWSIGQETPK